MTDPQRIGIDLAEQKVLADIAEYGWHCMNVVEDDGQYPWSPGATKPFKEWQPILGRPPQPTDEAQSRTSPRRPTPGA